MVITGPSRRSETKESRDLPVLVGTNKCSVLVAKAWHPLRSWPENWWPRTHGVKRIGPRDYQLAEPLRKFFERFILALQPKEGVHVVFPPQGHGGRVGDLAIRALNEPTGVPEVDDLIDSTLRPPAGREWNFYGYLDNGAPRVGLFSYVDDNAKPWTKASLHEAVMDGQVGMLDPTKDNFHNPYLKGRGKSITRTISPIWKLCGGPEALPARMAWEVIFGARPWRWEFETQYVEDHYVYHDGPGLPDSNPKSRFDATRERRLRDVKAHARRAYQDYQPAPDMMPLYAFGLDKSTGKRSWLGNIVYYLMEYPQGPGLSAERTREVVRARDRRHVTRALQAFLEANPDAPQAVGTKTEKGPRPVLRDHRVGHH